jgi:hypothetical protein
VLLDPDGIEVSSESLPETSLVGDGNSFLLVFRNWKIQARRIDATGVVDAATIDVASSVDTYLLHEHATFDGTNYIVSFDSKPTNPTSAQSSEIRVARVSPNGTVLDSAPLTVSSGQWLENGPIASDGSTTLVTWTTSPFLEGPQEWKGRRIGKDGKPIDTKIWDLGSAKHRASGLVFNGSYVWHTLETSVTGSSYNPESQITLTPWIRRFDPNGAALDAPYAAPSFWSADHASAIAASSGNLLLAYAPILGAPDDTHRARARLFNWTPATTCTPNPGAGIGADGSGAEPIVNCDLGPPPPENDGGMPGGTDGGSGGAIGIGGANAGDGGLLGGGPSRSPEGSPQEQLSDEGGLRASGGCAFAPHERPSAFGWTAMLAVASLIGFRFQSRRQ